MAIKIDRTVELSKTALAENKCVVIGLQSTGESRLNDAVADEVILAALPRRSPSSPALMPSCPTAYGPQ